MGDSHDDDVLTDGREGSTTDVFVGKDLGWKDVDTSPEAVDHYVRTTGDANPWYRGESPLGRAVLPATFLHFRAFEHNPGWFPESQHGTLFAGLSLSWSRPLFVGDAVRTHAWVSEIQRKGARWHITCDVEVFDPADRIALRTRTTQTFLVDSEYRGMVRTKADTRTPPTSRLGGPGTTAMTSLNKFVTTEMCTDFFGGTKNYHTDVDESAKMGFDDIVVGGPMSVCYIGDMLTQNIGPSLFAGGQLTIRFVDILWPEMEISVVGTQADEPLHEFGRRRYPFELEVQDPTGRTTVLASGSSVSLAGD